MYISLICIYKILIIRITILSIGFIDISITQLIKKIL